jgi:hypothetical protein
MPKHVVSMKEKTTLHLDGIKAKRKVRSMQCSRLVQYNIIEMNVKEISFGDIRLGNRGEIREASVRVPGVPVEIRTEYPANTSLEC